jgi:hypothetical protein
MPHGLSESPRAGLRVKRDRETALGFDETPIFNILGCVLILNCNLDTIGDGVQFPYLFV